MGFSTSFLGLILISRCHDIYHLGVLALLTEASGICFSFLRFFGSLLLPLPDGQADVPGLVRGPVVGNNIDCRYQSNYFLKLLALPCHPDSIRRVM